MGYAEKREKSIKKKRIVYLIVSIVALLGVIGLIVFSFVMQTPEWKYNVSLPNVQRRSEKEMRIHYIDVGQGDATLIELPDGKIMLIDGGDGSETANYALMRYLNALKIQTIDYLVVTHADTDHCGGLSEVLKYKEIKRAFLPVVQSTAENGNNLDYVAYQSFFTALQKEGCLYELSRREISLGITDGETPYTLAFLYPYTLDVNNPDDMNISDNNASAVIWLDYKGVSAIFLGDVDKTVENTLIQTSQLGLFHKDVHLSSTEILKVAHHGSNSSTSAQWLSYLGVKTAVISCGENNVHGHPSLEVSQRLIAASANVYRTDTQGTITVTVSAEGAYVVTTAGK